MKKAANDKPKNTIDFNKIKNTLSNPELTLFMDAMSVMKNNIGKIVKYFKFAELIDERNRIEVRVKDLERQIYDSDTELARYSLMISLVDEAIDKEKELNKVIDEVKNLIHMLTGSLIPEEKEQPDAGKKLIANLAKAKASIERNRTALFRPMS